MDNKHEIKGSQESGQSTAIPPFDDFVLTNEVSGFEQFDQKEIDEVVGDVMRYVLFLHNKKLPVKKDAITKNIIRRRWSNKTSGLVNNVMRDVRNRFRTIFGLDLYELPSKRRPPASQRAGSQVQVGGGSGIYILINPAENPEPTNNLGPKKSEAERGLIMVILSLLYLEPNMTEGKLWHYLSDPSLGLCGSNGQPLTNHQIFGDLSKLKNLVSQLYLTKDRIDIPSSQDQKKEYVLSIGPRGFGEVNNIGIYSFMSKEIMGQEVDARTIEKLKNERLPPPPPPPKRAVSERQLLSQGSQEGSQRGRKRRADSESGSGNRKEKRRGRPPSSQKSSQ